VLLAIAVAVNYVRRCSPALVATLKHRRNFYCGNAPAAYLACSEVEWNRLE